MFNDKLTSNKLVEESECCGCMACVQKCPQQAISIYINKEGFEYPKIDDKKCVNCGLCSKVCPQFKTLEIKKDKFPKTYAMYNKDDDELKQSSSGGIFSVLANYILEKKGTVYGAIYDEHLQVIHNGIENKNELCKIRSSKYVQSNIRNTFSEVEMKLKEGKLVLYTGTPCQIAGLKAFLMKDYENLLTCDLVCHGVPSPKLFEVYLKYLSKKFKSEVVNYNFRTKEKKGWGLHSRVMTKDGKIRYLEPELDPYYSNFLEGNVYREACYSCHYSQYNRCANITLADYWGIKDIHPDFYSKNGISLILINDEKGEEFIKKISMNIEMIETNIENAAENNCNLKKPSIRTSKRNSIYKGIDTMDEIKYIRKKLRIKYSLKNVIKLIIPSELRIKIKQIINK